MTAILPRRSTTPMVEKRRVSPALAPIIVGLIGLVTSLSAISTTSVWYDEAATITASTRSWPQLFEMLGTVDAVHGAYYVGMHVLFDLVGYSPVTLRLPSAIAVALTAAALVLLARQFGRPRLGVIAAVAFLTLPRVTWMATEGRSYAFTALLAVLVTMALAHAVHAKTRTAWIAYAVLVVLSCTVFIYLALVIVAHAAAMATRPEARRWLRYALASALALVPLAIVIVSQSGQVSWLGRPSLRQVFLAQWFYSSLPFAIIGWALMVIGSVFLIRRPGFSIGSLAVPIIVLPTLLLVAASFVMPLYTPRYVSMCLPFVAIAIGAAIDRVGPAVRVGIVLAVLVGLAVPQAVAQRQPEAREDSSWAQVATFIAADRGDAATAVVYGNVYGHPTATARVIEYAYPEAFRATVDVTLDTPAAETGRLWETTSPLRTSLDRLAGIDVTYLVTSTSRDRTSDTTRVLADAGWYVADVTDFTHIHVIRYERASQ